MRGSEVVDRVRRERSARHCCIKSWGEGHKFVDFELIDRFIEKVKPDDTIEDFVLLDLEQMWEILTTLDPDKLTRVQREEKEVIEWQWRDKEGTERTNSYPFSAEGIMTIMNDEFFA